MRTHATEDLHAAVEGRLRRAHQRYTGGRRRLVELLHRASRPLSIPELTSGRERTPQSSAYRNLAVLEQAGAVRRVTTDEDYARFELAEDLTGHHHHHLICGSCGRVDDVAMPSELEGVLDRSLDRVARKAGYSRITHRLDLVGLCAACAARG
jgi:Fe2+ or Zn2+ uptake regulation protein